MLSWLTGRSSSAPPTPEATTVTVPSPVASAPRTHHRSRADSRRDERASSIDEGGHARLSLEDDAYWRTALSRMPLEWSQFLAPLDSTDSSFHVSEAQYTHLAPRILDAFPAVSHLRFKIVPSRIKEDRFWATLFFLIAQWHEQQQQQTQPQQASPTRSDDGVEPATRETSETRATFAMPKKVRTDKRSITSPTTPSMAIRTEPASATSVTHDTTELTSSGTDSSLTTTGLRSEQPISVLIPSATSPPVSGTVATASAAEVAAAVAAATAAASSAAAAEIHSLQAQLSSKDAIVEARDREIAMLRRKVELLAGQLQSVASLVASSLAVAAATATSASELDDVVDAHNANSTSGATHRALHLSPSAAVDPQPANSSPQPDDATSPPSSSQVAPAPGAPSITPQPERFSCTHCRTSVSLADDASSPSPCLTHSGSWTLSRDSEEFFQLPPDLRANLRAEKQRRLAAVRHEMRFIIDEDDHTTAPGQWECCRADDYSATGCEKRKEHQLERVQ